MLVLALKASLGNLSVRKNCPLANAVKQNVIVNVLTSILQTWYQAWDFSFFPGFPRRFPGFCFQVDQF